MRKLYLSILSAFIVSIAIAAATSSASTASNEPTRIEIDQKKHTIAFVVDGKQVMLVKQSGALVRGNVEYEGMIKDIASSNGRPATEPAKEAE